MRAADCAGYESMLSAVVWVVMMTGAVMCSSGSGYGRVDVADVGWAGM